MKRTNTAADFYNTGSLPVDFGDGVKVDLAELAGLKGDPGVPGAGVPTGGSALQLIRKDASGATTEWVTPDKAMVGLSNVDNTADADKPVSLAAAEALTGKVARGELLITAKDAGAIGNGITDDTAALQTWLNTPGPKVLTAGTYKVTAELILSATGTMIVPGMGKIIADTADETVLRITGTRNIVEGLRVDGNNLADTGIDVRGAQNTVKGCTVENIFSSTVQAVGITSLTLGGVTIAGNTIRNVNATYPDPIPADAGYSRGILLWGNGHATAPSLVSGNYVDGVGGSGGAGIQIAYATADGSAPFYSAHATITGNVFKNCTKRIVKAQASHITISNNRNVNDHAKLATSENAIDVIDCSYVDVIGNHIDASRFTSGIQAASISNDPAKWNTHINITDNTIYGANLNAINVYNFKEINVSNNDAGGTGNGIRVKTVTGGKVDGNYVTGAALDTASFGISVEATASGLMVSANLIAGTGRTVGLSVLGDGHVISENTVTATAGTVNLASATNSPTAMNIVQGSADDIQATAFAVSRTGNVRASAIYNYASFANARLQLPTTGAVIDRNVADANATLKVNTIHASATGDIAQFQAATVLKARFNKTGHLGVRANAAPADADVVAGEAMFWVDSTNGAAKLMVKAKQADGTVKTASIPLA